MKPGIAEMRPFLDRIGEADSPEEEKKIRAEMSAEMDRLKKAAAEDVQKALTPEQNGRFNQIMIQKIGPGAILMDDYNESMKLSDDQKAELKKLMYSKVGFTPICRPSFSRSA